MHKIPQAAQELLKRYSDVTRSNFEYFNICSEPLRAPRSADFANLQNLLRARVATLQVCRWTASRTSRLF
jgi:hypothetical protein